MRLISILLSSFLLSCAKHPSVESLQASKWTGSFNINSSCEYGSYTGAPLMACMVLDTAGGGVVTAAVDWDSAAVQEDCDYFAFHGTFNKAGLILVRTDDPEERDDTLTLTFSGNTVSGTFQAHPSCDKWPVSFQRVSSRSGNKL